MSFQFIINNATQISFNSKAMVAQTTSRSGVTISTLRNHQPWIFTVSFPEGPRWTDYRQLVAAAEGLDRYTETTINFSQSAYDWLFHYQGDASNITNMIAGWVRGDQFATVTGGSPTQWRFRAGDFIQLGNFVYKVTADVPAASTNVPVHRPIIQSGTGTIQVGQNVNFRVKCVDFPDPVIIDRNQFGFTGDFRFVEVMDHEFID